MWGAYHGLLLGCERWRGKQSLYAWSPRPVRVGVTFVLMLLAWVLFRADDLTAALHYFAAMFGARPGDVTAPLLAAGMYTPYRLLVLAVCGLLVFQPVQAHDWAQQPPTWGQVAVVVPLFAISVMVMFSQAFNPFLYFQF